MWARIYPFQLSIDPTSQHPLGEADNSPRPLSQLRRQHQLWPLGLADNGVLAGIIFPIAYRALFRLLGPGKGVALAAVYFQPPLCDYCIWHMGTFLTRAVVPKFKSLFGPKASPIRFVSPRLPRALRLVYSKEPALDPVLMLYL
jgi:hypothetical protein